MCLGKRILAFTIVLLSALSLCSPLNAREAENLRRVSLDVKGYKTIADAFIDEDLTYEIGFWFFEKVAMGKLTFRQGKNGEYVATLTAYTTGMVDRIIRRKDIYTSRMRLADGGKRLVTVSFERTVDNNGKLRKGLTEYDYRNRVIQWRAWNGEEKHGEMVMPQGVYLDDPIAAFYNFRYGAYGAVEEGREYRIKSMPRKEDVIPEIELRIATRDEFMKAFQGKKLLPADFLAFARVQKELFGSNSGDIEIFFTDEMIPTRVVAKDILLLGDVRGRLSTLGVPGESGKASIVMPVSD